ncbi:TraR/DksA family transcriptional regulator [Streptomyces sp. NRRL F-5126]|uniref:TraR/DksA family transcriptional regulator n=1 Tax=Streptomyces sp. NRRL F-5126 TaxID=1463857 RepID=UPI001F3A7CAD|nr:TraR/DksA family transcriptional regulator [Streptomyces sp. NRRL F-5126]
MDEGIEREGPAVERRKAASELIAGKRESTARLVGSLTRLWDDVVAASALTGDDDEHDPEGATVAFERAQLRDTLVQARGDLEALDRAARRVATGEYWVCERCGGPIAAARLAARPTATCCIGCAGRPAR